MLLLRQKFSCVMNFHRCKMVRDHLKNKGIRSGTIVHKITAKYSEGIGEPPSAHRRVKRVPRLISLFSFYYSSPPSHTLKIVSSGLGARAPSGHSGLAEGGGAPGAPVSRFHTLIQKISQSVISRKLINDGRCLAGAMCAGPTITY